MEALEYIKMFKMDQPNYDFDRNKFIETFGTEFKEYLESPNFGIDPETGKLPYQRFKEIVKNFELKFKAISDTKCGKPLSKPLWGAFYAIWVIPLRKKLFPEMDKKIRELNTKRVVNNPNHPRNRSYAKVNNTDTRDKI